MTAEEARKIMLEAQPLLNRELNKIYEMIKDSAERGESRITLPLLGSDVFKEKVTNSLIQSGFKAFSNCDGLLIEWK